MSKQRRRRTYETPYQHPDWTSKRLHRKVLERDGGLCQRRISSDCSGPQGLTAEPNRPNTMQLGHVINWRTAGGEWWALENLQTECKGCNAKEKNDRKNAEGWRHSPTKIVLVVSPPCGLAGQHAAKEAKRRDLIIDFDAICRSLGSTARFDHPEHVRAQAMHQYRTQVRRARRGDMGEVKTLWLVSANAKAEEVFAWHHEVEVVDPGRRQARKLVKGEGRRRRGLVDEWYVDRERFLDDSADEVDDDWDW